MKQIVLMVVIPLTLIALFFWFTRAPDGQLPDRTSEKTAGNISASWETKVDEQSSVTIEVTPLELGNDAAEWRFAVALDTHSVDLGNDMRSSVLTDEKGNVSLPTAWKGAEPGGHHREGVLVFDAMRPVPQAVSLVIKDVGGVAERTFTWELP